MVTVKSDPGNPRHCTRIATQTVLQQPRELGLSVGHVAAWSKLVQHGSARTSSFDLRIMNHDETICKILNHFESPVSAYLVQRQRGPARWPFLAGSPSAEMTLPSAKSPELMETLSLKRLPTAPVPAVWECNIINIL